MKLSYLDNGILNNPPDIEWSKDWTGIRDIFDLIDKLEQKFCSLDVPYLMELSQKQVILNLRKYAFSLNKVILEKYGGLRIPDEELI